MNRRTLALACLLLAVLVASGCKKTKSAPPAMPGYDTLDPGPGATPLEAERYRLEEEKRSLSENFSDNIDRIQRINARIIQINIELQRQNNPHY
jgi:hypothetical protein